MKPIAFTFRCPLTEQRFHDAFYDWYAMFGDMPTVFRISRRWFMRFLYEQQRYTDADPTVQPTHFRGLRIEWHADHGDRSWGIE